MQNCIFYKINRRLNLILILLLTGHLAAQEMAPEDRNWDNRFGLPGVSPVYIKDAATFKDEIYVAGEFDFASTIRVNNVAKFNIKTNSWQALGNGVKGWVNSIDLDSQFVYIGGRFNLVIGDKLKNVAKWNGKEWLGLGEGLDSTVYVVHISKYKELYAGGEFKKTGTTTVNHIAKWDGIKWTSLAGGLNGPVHAIYSTDKGVYVGGQFTQAGNVAAKNIALWNGSKWLPVGEGLDGVVRTINGQNEAIYAGGSFTLPGKFHKQAIAKWDGLAWSSISGSQGDGLVNGEAFSIVFNNTEMYVAGTFSYGLGTLDTQYLLKWDGTNWTGLEPNPKFTLGPVLDVIPYGSNLYLVGSFIYLKESFSEVTHGNIVKWSANQFAPLYTATDLGVPMPVNAVKVKDKLVYVDDRVWDGKSWSKLKDDINLRVKDIQVYRNNIYFLAILVRPHSGNFSIYRWNGVDLVDMIPGYTEPTINSFAFKDTLLYAGGTFSEIGNTYAKHIAVWNGQVWKPLGSGTNGRVETIAVFNNELYVGGFFSQIDNVSAKNIAKWKGGQWVEVGGGTDGTVQEMKVSPDGTLIVGGNFFKCGPNETGSLVKWDGQKWIPFSIPVRGSIADIAFANNSIYIGGSFRIMADAEIYAMAAKWNSAKWVTFGSGTNANVTAIDVLENKIYIGGGFTMAGGKPSYHFAQWNEPVDSSIIDDDPAKIANIHLLQNYPNPFNPMTTISYSIPKSSFVELKVFDLAGKQIKTLAHEFKNAGRHRLNFDASGLANGIYFYRLQVNNFVETKKMLFIR